ncbi:MAG: EpsG family protein [Prevotella sp.]|nr:EpsG family protein [Prevotella sp.]MBQ8059116.1 EpsG family protein [Prevotella sp.]
MYFLPYVIVLIIFAVCAVIYAQRQDNEEDALLCTRIIWVAVGVFYIFFAFRGYAYSDWVGYSEDFKNVAWEDIFMLTDSKRSAVIHEPGFTALMCLCSIFTREYAFLVFVITTIDVVLFLRFLKRWDVRNVPFAFMIFITFAGVGLMFNALRNQLAIFIFINALEYIIEKKPIKYFSLCLAALCFHSSSIIFFPLYFFLSRKLNKWLFISLILCFIAFSVSQVSILKIILSIMEIGGVLGEKAEIYTEYYASAREFAPTVLLEKLGLCFLVFLFYDTLTVDKKTIVMINSLIIYLFFFYVFGEFKILSSRLSLIFIYSYWVLWIRIMGVLTVQNNKRLYGGIFFLYCLYVTIFAYNLPIQEYDNILLGGKTQTERMKIFNKTFEDAD